MVLVFFSKIDLPVCTYASGLLVQLSHFPEMLIIAKEETVTQHKHHGQ